MVAAVLLEAVVPVLVELEEFELPHAARPDASIAQLASAPNLFLITTSPLAGLSLTGSSVSVSLRCRAKDSLFNRQ
jgi:hypothetical protein